MCFSKPEWSVSSESDYVLNGSMNQQGFLRTKNGRTVSGATVTAFCIFIHAPYTLFDFSLLVLATNMSILSNYCHKYADDTNVAGSNTLIILRFDS